MHFPYQCLFFKLLFWVAFTTENICVDLGGESNFCTNRAENCANYAHYCPGLTLEFEAWWEWMANNCEAFCGICYPPADSGCDGIPDSFFIDGGAKRYCSLTDHSSLTIATDCTTYGFAEDDECNFHARIKASLLCAPTAEVDCWEFDTNGSVCETFERCVGSEIPEGYEPITDEIPYIGSTFNTTCSEGWFTLPGLPTCTCDFPLKVYSCQGCTKPPTNSPSLSPSFSAPSISPNMNNPTTSPSFMPSGAPTPSCEFIDDRQDPDPFYSSSVDIWFNTTFTFLDYDEWEPVPQTIIITLTQIVLEALDLTATSNWQLKEYYNFLFDVRAGGTQTEAQDVVENSHFNSRMGCALNFSSRYISLSHSDSPSAGLLWTSQGRMFFDTISSSFDTSYYQRKMKYYNWEVLLTSTEFLQYTVSILISANMTSEELNALDDPYIKIQQDLDNWDSGKYNFTLYQEQSIGTNTESGTTATSEEDCETLFGLEFCNLGFPVIYIFILIIVIMSCWISMMVYMCYRRQKKAHSLDLEALETIRKDIDTIRRHIDSSATPGSLEDPYGLGFGANTLRSIAGGTELNNTTRSLPIPGEASKRDLAMNYAQSYPIIHQQNARTRPITVKKEKEVVDIEEKAVDTFEEDMAKATSFGLGGGSFADLDDFDNLKYLQPPESCGFWDGMFKACFEDPNDDPPIIAAIEIAKKSGENV